MQNSSTSSEPHWLYRAAVAAGLADPAALVAHPPLSSLHAWNTLQELGVDLTALLQRLGEDYAIEPADFSRIDGTAGRIITLRTAQRYHIFPLAQDSRNLLVATIDPFDQELEKALHFLSGRRVHYRLATPRQIGEQLRSGNVYSIREILDEVHRNEQADEAASEGGEAEIDSGEQPLIVQLANTLILSAVSERCSDIHIEPGEQAYQVRYRIDGLMQPRARLPRRIARRLLSRLRVMCRLPLTSRGIPLDGRTRLRAGERWVDLRLNLLPAMHGDKVTLRLLDPLSRKPLDQLGLHASELQRLRRLIDTRNGLLLVVGPTGSGKSSTLYALLEALRTEHNTLLTVEDPVEFELPGVTQVSVDEGRGLTFLSALRAALRQDPDIIMIGEIRDQETAETALKASETGHLVLSTLHANGALSALQRLLNLGLDQGLLLQALRGVVAQRLVRRLCEQCALPMSDAQRQEFEGLGIALPAKARLRVAVGCSACNETGFHGRLPLVELLEVDARLRRWVAHGDEPKGRRERGLPAGFSTLRDSALAHVFAGHTTLQEAARVVDIEELRPRRLVEEERAAPDEAGALRRQAHALVVDDDEHVRQFVAAILGEMGYRVGQAVNGQQALERAGHGIVYDLVVTDLEMPGVDGLRLIKALRANTAYADTPILVLSGRQESELMAYTLQIGADDYLHKPVRGDELVHRITGILSRHTEE